MKVTLRTYDGKHFVCAENGGGQGLIADRTEAHQWETFDLSGPLLYGGRVNLRTYDGIHYVCATNGGGQGLEVNRTEAREWESFRTIGPGGKADGSPVHSGEGISLQTYDGKHFVCADNGGGQGLIADRIEAHQWETFNVNFVSSAVVPVPSTRMIHISDTHFTDSSVTWDSGTIFDSQDSKQRSGIIASYLNKNASQLGTNIVVITGDLTDSGDAGDYQIAADFIQTLQGYGYVVFAVPGNHDYCKEGTLGNQLIVTGGKDNARRQRFIDYITHYSDYPHVKAFGNNILILLDSMQAEMDEDTGDHWAQGKLGNKQLSLLKQMLAGYQADRKSGKKVIVCLHHSPFHNTCDDTTGGLDDCEDFLGIIANKVDCLLFGHTGDIHADYPDQERMYGIPVINSENLEHAGTNIPITVVDTINNRIEVYPTDISQFPWIKPVSLPGGIHITPWVTRSNAVIYNYADAAPSVKFQSYDTVTITVGGGVQTGGHGKTWKRYVNPSGSNSDHTYFGEIYIPGVTAALTPIRGLVGAFGSFDGQRPDLCTLRFSIPNIDSLPESGKYLALSYTDDNYSDNGYWGHDDGTEDQCKNVGPAYVDISIQHNAPTPQTLYYNISPPVVDKSTPVAYNGSNGYQAIAFQKGDKVTIVAGGGVQTGGSGKTWKRYVNPSGPNSDHIYFGEIYIPGITGGLTAIRDLARQFGGIYDPQSPDKCTIKLTIPDINNMPISQRYMSLHYTDDNYSDNGYSGHDDGTEDQCKNVGPAYVNIQIQR